MNYSQRDSHYGPRAPGNLIQGFAPLEARASSAVLPRWPCRLVALASPTIYVLWWREQVCTNILNWYSYSMEEIGFKCNIQASLVTTTDFLTKNYHHHISLTAAHA